MLGLSSVSSAPVSDYVFPDWIIAAVGIATAFAGGSPSLQVEISPTGVATSFATGTQSIQAGISPTGIVGGEAFGLPDFQATISPSGVATAFATGTQSIGAALSPIGIAGAEAFGFFASIAFIVGPPGIPSEEGFGTHWVTIRLIDHALTGGITAHAGAALINNDHPLVGGLARHNE